MAYLPSWIMSQLEVKEEDEVTVTLVPNLVDGIKATFKINQQEQFLPNDPLKVLEEKLRHYSCLSLNDALEIEWTGDRIICLLYMCIAYKFMVITSIAH